MNTAEHHCDHHGSSSAHENKADFRAAASATAHCLTGCAIGEFVGLAIGVSIGLTPLATAVLATILAFISGYALTLIPFVRRGVPVLAALKVIWLGELVSISAMEIAMNVTDYQMGGMAASSLADLTFWTAYGGALLAGFAAGYPVNLWLLKKSLKHCHHG